VASGSRVGFMARVHRQPYSKRRQDGSIVRRLCRKWYIEYYDASGKRHNIPGFTDKRATEVRANEIQTRIDRQKAGILDAESLNLTAQLTAPIATHIDAYETHLRAGGVCPRHLKETVRRLNSILEVCEFRRLTDIRAEPIQRWVGRRRNENRAPRTTNTYLSSVRAFLRWCIADGRMAIDPLGTIRKLDESTDVRRVRRALTDEELVRLLAVAESRPLLEAMTIRRGQRKGQAVAKLSEETRRELARLGRERRLIYMTLVLTGLRKGELAQLRWADLDLDAVSLWLTVRAAVAKNRKSESVPVRADLAAELRSWRVESGNPPPTCQVFSVPDGLVRILDRDLVAAGIARRVKDENGVERIDKCDDQGRTIDVHALRHTTATHLAKAGVAPRTAQAILRHSDIRLTLGRYTDPRLLDTAAAVDALPSLKSGPDSQRMKATGTYGKANSELGAQLGGKGRAAKRGDARPRTQTDPDNRPAQRPQLPVDAGVSTDLHYNASQRAIGFEPTTSSLGKIQGENVNHAKTRTNGLS